MEKKENTKSLVINYFKVILLYTLVVIIVLILRDSYIKNKNYELNIPVISKTITQELNKKELDNYIRENEVTVIYIGVANDDNCRKLEKNFNKIIKKKNLENTIKYLNITDIANKKEYIKDFNQKYNSNLKTYPAVVIFKNSNVVDIINGKDITSKEIGTFLERNNIVGDEFND